MKEAKHEHYLIEKTLQTLCRPKEQVSPEEERDSEIAEAFVQFMEGMPGGFLIYYADGGEEIIYANRSVLRLFGCDTMEEFRLHTHNSFRGLVHEDDLDEVEESIQTQITSSQYDLDYVEYRIRRRDGAIRWIEDYGHFVHSEEVGDIFYVILWDATEKRDRILEEKTRLVNEKLEKERKLQNLTEAYDKERSLINQEYLRQLEVIKGLSVNYESICFVDLDEDLVVPYRLSHRTKILFDDPPKPRPYGQYARSYIDAWVHPEDQDLVTEATSPAYIREKLAENQTYYFNFRVILDEELRYIQLRIVNVGQPSNACQAVFGYRRIDEEMQQQMEQQALLAEALAKANLAVTSKNTFLSNMSHEMRTPLHAIFGFTSLAKLNLDNQAEAMDYLERVEAAGHQLLDMIEKVLQVSTLSESTEVEEVECDLRETVEQVYEFLRPQAQEKNLLFSLCCSDLCHKAVYADREKLRQLILYLASNGIAYTNPGGQVTIFVTEGNELQNNYAEYRFSVKDTGIGIGEEALSRVFEPFSREKNSTLSGIQGVGLGLTIAKSLVDMMGGSITIESQKNEGSTFTATFSFRIQPQAIAAKKELEENGTPQRILLVEDNDITREIETDLLEQLGFAIDPVENGLIALEHIRASMPGEYDIILMDLQMPVMDGWQTAAEIRSLPDPELAKIPIISLAPNMLENVSQRSQESGINAHLVKPIDLTLLLRTIEDVTGKKCSGPRK